MIRKSSSPTAARSPGASCARCRAHGDLRRVAVYSDADAGAPHVRDADEAVRIGPPPSRESYLAIDRIVAAARATGADAVHPGYGFLAENADFAERCADAGSDVHRAAARGDPPHGQQDRGEARSWRRRACRWCRACPASGSTTRRWRAAAQRRRLPAAGQGVGRRRRQGHAHRARRGRAARGARGGAARGGAAPSATTRCWSSATSTPPRHVEIQIFGDAHGHVVHLLRARVLDPAPLPEDHRGGAVAGRRRRRCARAWAPRRWRPGRPSATSAPARSSSSSTRTAHFYFLEVNTRLQVEHPVTEAVTGLDLVRAADPGRRRASRCRSRRTTCAHRRPRHRGAPLRRGPGARLPAGDRPPVLLWEPPALPGVRWDSGVETGSEVGVHYDPMLAKVIAHGADARRGAIVRLRGGARAAWACAGVTTNRDFLLAVLAHPAFARRRPRHPLHRAPPAGGRAPSRRAIRRPIASTPSSPRSHGHERRRARRRRRCRRAFPPAGATTAGGRRTSRFTHRRRDGRGALRRRGRRALRGRRAASAAAASSCMQLPTRTRLALEIDGVRRRFAVAATATRIRAARPARHGASWSSCRASPARAGDELAGGCLAPMTGIVREVLVKAGDRVEKGTVMLVLEAMKMEHQLTANATATVHRGARRGRPDGRSRRGAGRRGSRE